MLAFNNQQKAMNIARGGDLYQAQAIMKGFKRGMAKNVTNDEQAAVMKGLTEQLGSVYDKMEAQNYDHSDGEEQILS